MLNEAQAKAVVEQVFPKADIKRPIDYLGDYVFPVFRTDDPDEGDQDVFFAVNQRTGEIRDFCVITDGDIHDIAAKFAALKN